MRDRSRRREPHEQPLGVPPIVTPSTEAALSFVLSFTNGAQLHVATRASADPGDVVVSPALRQYLINELVPSIRAIGRDFEPFGTRYIDAVVGRPMKHRGLNVEGQPVGYTVDSVSEDGLTAAEYSSDHDYFSSPYTKPSRDYRHIRRLHPQATALYLVSSRLAGPQAETRLTRFTSGVKKRHNIDVHVHDARRIAEHIVDQLLLDDRVVDRLAPYLGTLAKVRDEYAATLQVPELSTGYIPHPAFQAEIIRRLRDDRFAALSGLGGSGKSETAAAVGHECSAHYKLVVWVPAATVTAVNDLKGVEVERGGRKINTLHLLKDHSCLLILDDLRAAIPKDSLLAHCGVASSVLVTRQAAQPGDLAMPQLDEAGSRSLLQHGLAEPCPDDVFADVRRAVGGHPLALKLMNAGVRRGGWNDLRADCAAIGEYHDEERTQKLADRVLGRMKSVVERELAFFAWCDSARVDRALARAVLHPVGIRKLEDACVLAPDRQDVLRIHDLVKTTIATIAIPVGKYAAGFLAAMDTYVDTLLSERPDDLAFFSLCQLHRPHLERLLTEDPNRYACLYILLHAWSDDELHPALIGDPTTRATAVANALYPSDVAVITILEAVEALYRRAKWVSGPKTAKVDLQGRMQVFDTLASVKNLSEDIRLRVLHHQAKALRNVDRYAEATTLCRQILDKRKSRSTRLLLARLLAYKDTSRHEAKELLFGLLHEARAQPHTDISVTLAAIAVLGRAELKEWFRDALAEYGPLLEKLIVEAAARGLDQAFVAFAAISRELQYNDEDLFFRVLDQLPFRAPGEVRDDRERGAWGDILLATARARSDTKEQLLTDALEWYGSLRQPSGFQLQQKGQTLFHLGRYAEARAVLEPLAEQFPNPWNCYWLSKSLLAAGDAGRALTLIEKALADPRSASFRSAMLEHRFDVRTALSDANALRDLREACDVCENQKYKAALTKRLEDLQ